MAKKRAAAKRAAPRAPQRTARWAAQREELLHAAQRAIRKRGEAVSMEDIAREAGITRPILYRHFGDRRGTAIALRDWMMAPFVSSLPPILYGRGLDAGTSNEELRDELVVALYAFVAHLATLIEANPEVYRFLRTQGMFDDKWEMKEGEWSDPLSEGVGRVLAKIAGKRGVEPQTARVWGYALIAMVGGPLEWWAVTRTVDRVEIERDLMQIIRGCVDGLTASLPTRRRPAPKPPRRRAGSGKR